MTAIAPGSAGTFLGNALSMNGPPGMGGPQGFQAPTNPGMSPEILALLQRLNPAMAMKMAPVAGTAGPGGPMGAVQMGPGGAGMGARPPMAPGMPPAMPPGATASPGAGMAGGLDMGKIMQMLQQGGARPTSPELGALAAQQPGAGMASPQLQQILQLLGQR